MNKHHALLNVGDLMIVDARHTTDIDGASVYQVPPAPDGMRTFISYAVNNSFVFLVEDRVHHNMQRDYVHVMTQHGAVGWVMLSKLKHI
jgi:hypothetical protein